MWNIPIQILLRINLRCTLSIHDRWFWSILVLITIFKEWWATTYIRSDCTIGRNTRIVTRWSKRFLAILLSMGHWLPRSILIPLLALFQSHISKILLVLYKPFLWCVNIVETAHCIVINRCWLLLGMSMHICKGINFTRLLIRIMLLRLTLDFFETTTVANFRIGLWILILNRQLIIKTTTKSTLIVVSYCTLSFTSWIYRLIYLIARLSTSSQKLKVTVKNLLFLILLKLI